MTDDFALLWKDTLNEAEKIINRPSFETWLKATIPVSLFEKTIVVEVPNEFTKEWLETRYQKLLQEILKKVSDYDYNINFVCNNSPDSSRKIFTEEVKPEYDTLPAENVSLSTRKPLSKLNPKYTFETFVIGSCNRLAHAASLAVSEAPSRAYNPLFIYGGVGLGKTHLMQAIGHFVFEKYFNLNVLYLSSEKFTNDFINSIRDNKTVEFRNKYRNIDVLLIDDIQFLAGKEQTQEEFFHTFNALHENNKQIVISSDRPPKEIPTLEDRLRSRFEWGLITDIQPPDLETRIAILKKKTHFEKIHFPDTVLNYIGNKIETNIRELEGALIRIMAYSSLNNLPIDIKIADEALKDIIVEKKKTFTVKEIISVTAKHFGISPQDISAKKRSKNIAFPRQIAMYLSRELTDIPLIKIGEGFGGKDHSTVIHGHKKIANEIAENIQIKEIVNKIIKALELP